MKVNWERLFAGVKAWALMSLACVGTFMLIGLVVNLLKELS